MADLDFLTADDVAKELKVSKAHAYKVIRLLNEDMRKNGYITIRGRVNACYFRKKTVYKEEKGE